MLPLLPFLLIFTAVTTNSELDKMFQVQEDGTMSGSVEGPFFFITFFSTIAFAIFVLKSKLTTALFVSSLLFLLAAIGALFGSFDESTSRPTMMLLSVFGLFLYAFSLLILYGADWMLGKLRNVLGLKN